MIAVISPAMNMKIPDRAGLEATRPVFWEEAQKIGGVLASLQPWEFEEWMHVSPKLAAQAFVDAREFAAGREGSPAILTYTGLVYRYIRPLELSGEELLYAQDHLCILSALYGALRPLDAILPYRLEMACRLPIEGKRLYTYWGDRLYTHLFGRREPVVNLASEEYAKAVRRYLEPVDLFLDIQFLVWKNGKLRTITAWAKMARGAMVRQIIKNRWDRPDQLREFEWEGFSFEEALSDEKKYVFVRRALEIGNVSWGEGQI